MSSRDLYSILGVSKSASDKEIKKAYHKLAQQYHPDRNPDNAQAEARFKEVAAAFDVLKDSKKRALYDEFGADGLREGFNPEAARQWGGGGSPFGGGFGGFGGDFGDILDQILGGRRGGGSPFGGGHSPFGGGHSPFGGGYQAPSKGADIETQVSVPFQTAIEGGKVHLSQYQLDFKVPAGVYEGQKLKLKGKGQSGPGGRGDLKITLKLTLPDGFEEYGESHLIYTLPITLSQATLGDRISIPKAEGGSITLTLPPQKGIQTKIRIPKKGRPIKGGQRGHLYIMPVIRPLDQLPSSESVEEFETLQNLLKQLEEYYS